MKRRRRFTHGLRHLFEASLESPTGGGSGTPISAPAEAPTDAPASSGQKTGENGQAELSEAARPSLADIVTRITGEGEQDAPAPKEAKSADATLAPKEQSPKEEQSAEALKPEAKAEGEEGKVEKPGEFKLLSDEEIEQQHPKAPKPLREYSKQLARQYTELKTTIDEVGGVKGLKTLDAVVSSLTGTDRDSAKSLQDAIQQRNPALMSALQTDIFYGAVDEHPEFVETLIKTALGDQFDGDTLKAIKAAAEAGEIDLAEIKANFAERQKTRDPEAWKRIEALEKQLGQNGQKQQESPEQAETRARITGDVVELRRSYTETVNPILREAGLIASKDDPAPIQGVKKQFTDIYDAAISAFVARNKYWASINNMIYTGMKGEVWDWTMERAMNSVVAFTKEWKSLMQPAINHHLAAYNAKPAKNNRERTPEPEDDTSATGKSQLEADESIPLYDLTETQKKARLAAIVNKQYAAG